VGLPVEHLRQETRTHDFKGPRLELDGNAAQKPSSNEVAWTGVYDVVESDIRDRMEQDDPELRFQRTVQLVAQLLVDDAVRVTEDVLA